MAPAKIQRISVVLQKVCLVYMVVLGVKHVTALKACPIACSCVADDHIPNAGTLVANCQHGDILVIPQLTAKISSLVFWSSTITYIDGFAFSGAPLLWRIEISAQRLTAIHRDAFQSLSNLSELKLYSKQGIPLDSGLFRSLPRMEFLSLQTQLTRIPNEALCSLSHISSLSLPDNKISSVNFDVCVSLAWSRIQQLDLSGNYHLRNLTADDFYNFKDHNVTTLSLKSCSLEKLTFDVFKYLPRLTFLDIRQNKIKFLPPGIFDHLSNLESLLLGQRDLAAMPFTANSSFMPVLQNLDIAGSTHMNLSFTDAFLSATSLRKLQIYTNTLNDSFFANLVHSPVTYLEIKGSSIAWLSAAAFDPLQSLQELVISSSSVDGEMLHNASMSLRKLPLQRLSVGPASLKVLDSRSFEGFRSNNSLTFLSLQSTKIERIGQNSFSNLHEVQTLNLSHNLLTNKGLEYGALHGLFSLQYLNLRNNGLTSMPGRIHLGLGDFTGTLELSGNNFASVTSSDFEEWSNVTVLYLNHNEIDNIGDGFGQLNNLQFLDLSGNGFRSVPRRAFAGLPSLTVLHLDDNRLSQLGVKTFQSMPLLETLTLYNTFFFSAGFEIVFQNLHNIQYLNLMQCGITKLPDQLFINNQKLDTLKMSGNSIVSWKPEVFEPLQKLTILTLNGNRIASIPRAAFAYLTSLRQLDLSDNPLACTCEILWFKHWINTADLYLVDYTIKKKYICASPEHEKGTPLIDFQLSDDDCASHVLFHILMGLVYGVVFMCTVISLVYRYRWYIRYYVFLLRSRRRQMQDALFENEAFKFDVYVCYHNTSRRWVIKELLPKLEHEAGIKLCLHDRNWLAGPAISENIIESIEQSRKTLLLVNNGFARSAWCREETTFAYHHLLETQRNMLIVVLLEDVKPENMDKLLRYILTNRVYLKYTGGKVKERRFWKALKAALRKREHPNAGVELERA